MIGLGMGASHPDSDGRADKAGGESALAQTMDAIKAHIRENGLQVGDSLPSEGAFAEQLGVSRGIVREAYRSLSALTLIDIGNGRRPRVTAPKADVLALVTDHAMHTDQVTIQQIFDVRRTVERRTVVLATLPGILELPDDGLGAKPRAGRLQRPVAEIGEGADGLFER